MMADWFSTPLSRQLRYGIYVIFCILLVLLAACSSSGSASTGSTPTPKPTPSPIPTPNVPAVSKVLTTYKGHSGPVISAQWSPDGTRIASCGNDGTVQVWTASDGKTIWNTSIDRYAFALAWSPDGKKLVGGGSSSSLFVLDAANGHQLATYQGQGAFIEGLAWSPNGQFIASGSQDDTVMVWDVTTGKSTLTYKGHSDAVAHVAWSPDGTKIASGTGSAGASGPVTDNNAAKVWNAATGQTLLSIPAASGQVYALAW